jgi:acyl-CoA synthetase (AMP-forming)/AMP-acid ligase II
VRGEQISGEYGARTALDADGWFGTRDLGRLDDDGYLFIEGRADDTIIRGGENIGPAEIEDVLRNLSGVIDVAVFGVADDEWGQRTVAAIVTQPDSDLTSERVRVWAREHLRGSRTPDEVVFRAELPYTPTGKLLRRQLVDEYAEVAS